MKITSSLQVYNTLTRKKEKFIPIVAGKVSMYVCGPTTYNFIHLGNARPIVVFDTVRRYLQYLNYQVTYVQNFTDVDDKIINKAREEEEAPLDMASKYIKEYFVDTDKLNVKRADFHPKVSENITEIVQFVKDLEDKGMAYEIDGDVYFAVRKFENYGKLSGRSFDDLQAGARVEVDVRKNDPLDFALWKKAKEGELSWESPWGQGRPGWHIECSAMSCKYLGEEFDIHGGGSDLVFPHHENEIAQSESLQGKSMAKYWIHNGFITVNQEKMSKSLGNFFLLRDIYDKFDPMVVRFYLLSTHYRSHLDFDDEKLGVAQKGLERLKNAYFQLEYGMKNGNDATNGQRLIKASQKAQEEFIKAMDDDFNTALAIAALFDLTREVNTYFKETELDQNALAGAKKVYDDLLEVLGLTFVQEETGDNQLTEGLMEMIIEIRQNSRKDKDFALADLIRDKLKALGVTIEDTPQGPKWKTTGKE